MNNHSQAFIQLVDFLQFRKIKKQTPKPPQINAFGKVMYHLL